jgi:hypothetical protein
LDRPGAFGQRAPIGAELERHHDTANHAHCERQAEYLEPEIENASVYLFAGRQPHSLDCCEPGGEPDRESGENNVEADDECKLQT